MKSEEARRNQTWIWVSLGIAVVVIGVFAFLAGLYYTRTVTPTSIYFFPWLPLGFGSIGVIFSFFFLFWVISWCFRPWGWGWGWGYRRRYRWWREDSASQILRERYAKGELTKEQFEQMLRDLEEHS